VGDATALADPELARAAALVAMVPKSRAPAEVLAQRATAAKAGKLGVRRLGITASFLFVCVFHSEAVIVRPPGALDRASPNFMGLASLGLEIGIFCGFIYSILLLNAIFWVRYLRANPIPAAASGWPWTMFGAWAAHWHRPEPSGIAAGFMPAAPVPLSAEQQALVA
jgi:hypothetical protein